ncbi:hypothetical protein KQX54_011537 [Cotesia glomerata]|uniref:Ankyrin repeat protein n=1 Tax=Cotesia glomerata TaxID=32391 RepID=A0AAV7IKT4_COTGL|nr:hypothetical protein KQX54_011537 [Cotesia glomerata]
MSAHINSHDYDNKLKSCTVLHLAARNGNKAMLEILLKEGADVQARDEKDETPLHVAITKENTEAVGFLIQHGADVHLLDNGVYVDTLDRNGKTPSIIAIHAKKLQSIEQILQYCPNL